MQPESAYPDWRNANAYAPLLDADRSLFAWEWLRRDPHYRTVANRALSTERIVGTPSYPQRFGLVAFESPDLAVPHARPLWRSDLHSFVLPVEPCGARLSAGEEIDVKRMGNLARIMIGPDGEHLLLSDGLRSIRLDGPEGVFSRGPTCLRYSIEGLTCAEPRLFTLRRFLALCRTGHFSRSLHPREVRGRRWIMMLRTWDGLCAGASQREIAEVLLSRSVADPGWRCREPSVRSQVQRMVHGARLLANGDYRRLLGEVRRSAACTLLNGSGYLLGRDQGQS